MKNFLWFSATYFFLASAYAADISTMTAWKYNKDIPEALLEDLQNMQAQGYDLHNLKGQYCGRGYHVSVTVDSGSQEPKNALPGTKTITVSWDVKNRTQQPEYVRLKPTLYQDPIGDSCEVTPSNEPVDQWVMEKGVAKATITFGAVRTRKNRGSHVLRPQEEPVWRKEIRDSKGCTVVLGYTRVVVLERVVDGGGLR